MLGRILKITSRPVGVDTPSDLIERDHVVDLAVATGKKLVVQH